MTVDAMNLMLDVHRKWLSNNALQLSLRSKREFEKYLPREGFGSLRVNALSLGTLASIFSKRFLLEDPDQSSLFDQSLALLATEVQVSISIFLKEANFGPNVDVPTGEMDELPLLIAACALRKLPNTHRQLVLLQRHFRDLNKPMIAIKQRFNVSGPFRFIYELECAKEQIDPGKGLVDARDTLGPYWPLLSWNTIDAESFGRDLHMAADHRMTLITTDDSDRIAPLGYVPFDIFPAELLYVVELRKRQGLQIPQITHPLMTPWLHFDYAQGPLPTDEVIDRVRSKCKDYGVEIVLD